jgi:hypothetical protein
MKIPVLHGSGDSCRPLQLLWAMKTALESDVSTLDGIIYALYEVLSGPAGQPRNWERYRTLFVDGARLMPVVAVAGGKPHVRQLRVEDYISRVEPIFAVENFWERETSRQTEIIGRIAHVLSRYESLRDPHGPPFEHGVNSMQLFYDDSRWWVISVMWNTSRSA